MAETKRGTYVGPLPNMKGREAMLLVYEGSTRCLAQFDDTESGYGFGWHDFAVEHFEIEEPADGE